MQFRTLNIILFVLVAIGIALALWEYMPGEISGSMWNVCSKRGVEVPVFVYGAYDFDREDEYQIAYLALIQQASDFSVPPQWIEERNDRIFVEGRRVRPRTGVVKLFVSHDKNDPERIILTHSDARAMQAFLNQGQNFETCSQFWEYLASKYDIRE